MWRVHTVIWVAFETTTRFGIALMTLSRYLRRSRIGLKISTLSQQSHKSWLTKSQAFLTCAWGFRRCSANSRRRTNTQLRLWTALSTKVWEYLNLRVTVKIAIARRIVFSVLILRALCTPSVPNGSGVDVLVSTKRTSQSRMRFSALGKAFGTQFRKWLIWSGSEDERGAGRNYSD